MKGCSKGGCVSNRPFSLVYAGSSVYLYGYDRDYYLPEGDKNYTNKKPLAIYVRN